MSRNKPNDRLNEEDEWLFESIVNYLGSPMWSIPIQHFFENNCSVFSPSSSWSGGSLLEDNQEDDEKKPKELLDVHKKYKDLVDTLINAFLQDIGISYSKFVRVCQNSAHFTQQPVYLELFEQVWCAENFKLFKAQMIRKNVELELQALVLLQYQLGIIKTGQVGGSNTGGSDITDDEIMALVIKKSKDEYDAVMNSKQRSRSVENDYMPMPKSQDMETANKLVKSDRFMENLQTELDQQAYINKQLVLGELNSKLQVVERPISASKKNIEILREMKSMKLEESSKSDGGAAGGSAGYRQNKYADDDDDIVSSDQASNAKLVNHLAENILAQSENISESEIKRRADFMRKQRDILTEKKRVERQKQLDMFMDLAKKEGGNSRPMSSRAARKILSGADPTEIKEATSSSSRSDEERKRLEARIALAETLKKEVINSSKSKK